MTSGPVPIDIVKYTNHLNVIVAIIGVIVIAQTLTRTFWSSVPEKKYSVEAPASRPKIQVQAARPAPAAAQKRAGLQPAGVLDGTAVTPSPSPVQPREPSPLGARGRLLTDRPVQQSPNSGIVGAPAGTSAGPNVVTIPSGPTGEMQSEPGRSMRGQVPFGARSGYRSRGMDGQTTTLPPPGGYDAGKRQPDPNAPPPPVRSSMPGQRVQ